MNAFPVRSSFSWMAASTIAATLLFMSRAHPQCQPTNVPSFTKSTFTEPTPEAMARFGYALAVGNVDGTSGDEIVVGIPNATTLDGRVNRGQVVVLAMDYTLKYTIDPPGGAGDPGNGAMFGAVLHVADLNSSSPAEISVGAPFADTSTASDAGSVYVYKWNVTMIDLHATLTHLNPSAADEFGDAITSGAFKNTGSQLELFIGVPYDDFSGLSNAGSVTVAVDVMGSANPVREEILAGTPRSPDYFGQGLAVGSFGILNEPAPHLAVGAYYSNLGTGAFALGKFEVKRWDGSVWKHLAEQDEPVSQKEGYTYFGYALAAGDFDGDGIDDLGVGAPHVGVCPFHPSGCDPGVFYVFRGGSTFPDVGQLKTFVSPEPVNPDSPGDRLGWSITTADVNGDGKKDFVVGSPFHYVNSSGGQKIIEAGRAFIVFGKVWNCGNTILSLQEDSPAADFYFGWSTARAAGTYDDVFAGTPEADLSLLLLAAGRAVKVDFQ